MSKTCNSASHITDYAKFLEEKTLERRHELHKIPELSWEEEKTLQFIKKELDEIINSSSLPFSIVEKKGGLWVDYTVNTQEKYVLFRADIDGLPIEEQTNLPFKSTHPGKMHACGHDCHTAMLLSAFELVAKGIITPKKNIRFLWQRAEESGIIKSGAEFLVEEGVLENVSHAYGLHISSILENGIFFSKPGIMMANSSQFSFEVSCSGGHVMHPEVGDNAIDILLDIQMALRGFEVRALGPNEPISFVPAIAQSGTAYNIRPEKLKIGYAMRNFLSAPKKQRFLEAIKQKILNVLRSYPSSRLDNFSLFSGYPMLVNDPALFQKTDQTLSDGELKTNTLEPLFSGEDFAYYANEVPSTFWCLGANRQEKNYDHHCSKFNPDESVLWQGVAFWLLLSEN